MDDVREPGREPASGPSRTPTVVDVSRRAAELGADLGRVVVGAVADVVPRAPSHRWVLFPTSAGGFVVGGHDRGAFAPFATFDRVEDAAQVLARWARPLEVPPIDRTAEQLAAAAMGARRVIVEAAAAGPVTGAAVPVGAPFDHIGTPSGHYLYLYGTPMSQRSLPPTDLSEERHGYLVTRALPSSCRVRTLPAHFGQPGGGLVVELDRVLAFHVETGRLAPFGVPSA